MAIVAIVRFEVEPETMRRFNAEHADLNRELLELGRRHGMLSHRQLYGDSAVVDIDEWPTHEARAAFLAEAAPQLQRFAAALGCEWSSTVWRDN
jgi:hypothetical protein